MDSRVDVAIIGGGVIGSAAAWRAASLAGADVRFGVGVRELRPVTDGIEVVTENDVVRPDGTSATPELFRFGVREEAAIR